MCQHDVHSDQLVRADWRGAAWRHVADGNAELQVYVCGAAMLSEKVEDVEVSTSVITQGRRKGKNSNQAGWLISSW